MSRDPPCVSIGWVEPVERRLRVGDIELCVFEWGRPVEDKPSLFLAHATGFHARCWDEILRRIGDAHAFAIDQRGHGRSTGSAVADWASFGEDLAQLAGELGGGPFFGVIVYGLMLAGYSSFQSIGLSRHQRWGKLIAQSLVIAIGIQLISKLVVNPAMDLLRFHAPARVSSP